MNRTYYIYKITNPKGRIYIGKTYQLDKRINHYRLATCKTQKLIYNSIKKYTWENHKLEIIFKTVCTDNDINIFEIKFIEFYNSYFPNNNTYGLNLTKGGEGSRGIIISQKQKDAISKANKTRVMTKETKTKISNNLKNKMNDPVYKQFFINKTIKAQKVGEKHHLSKLTELKVLEVIGMFNNGLRNIDVFNNTGINKSTIKNIKNKVAWKHLSHLLK